MHFVHLQHRHDRNDVSMTVGTTGRLILVLGLAVLAGNIVPPATTPADPPQQFADRWQEPTTAIARPIPVRTETYRPPPLDLSDPVAPPGRIEPVRPEPVPMPEAGDPVPKSQGRDTLTEEDKRPPHRLKQPRKTIAKATSNICTKHGLRKVNYGKRWRCRPKVTKD